MASIAVEQKSFRASESDRNPSKMNDLQDPRWAVKSPSLLRTSSSVSTYTLGATATAATSKPAFSPDSSSKESSSKESSSTSGSPPSLLRKKSGELLKSSLKLSSLRNLPRVMSTPQLKSVRFAARLANIKMFDGTESPSAVSTTDNSPVRSPEDTIRRRRSTVRRGSSDYFQMNDDLSSDTSDDEPTYKHASTATVKYQIAKSDVPPYQPFVSLTNSLYLQSLRLEESSLDGKFSLTGLINCANLGFEKHLMIKLTTDNWSSNVTFSNQSTTIRFHSSFPHVGIDQFQFKIPIADLQNHNLQKLSSELDIQLCIQYTVNKHVFWDNNGGKNYHVLLKPQSSIKTYTYKKGIDDYSQFDVLVSKLMTVKNESEETLVPANASGEDTEEENDENDQLNGSPRKSMHSRYNFGGEDTFARPQLKQSFSANDIFVPKAKYSQSFRNKNSKTPDNKSASRPALAASTPIVASTTTGPATPSTTTAASSAARSPYGVSQNTSAGASKSLASLSYTDLLANYCFSGGNTPTPTPTNVIPRSVSTNSIPLSKNASSTTSNPFSDIFGTTNFGSTCSPASTFHSFSDSIHT